MARTRAHEARRRSAMPVTRHRTARPARTTVMIGDEPGHVPEGEAVEAVHAVAERNAPAVEEAFQHADGEEPAHHGEAGVSDPEDAEGVDVAMDASPGPGRRRCGGNGDDLASASRAVGRVRIDGLATYAAEHGVHLPPGNTRQYAGGRRPVPDKRRAFSCWQSAVSGRRRPDRMRRRRAC